MDEEMMKSLMLNALRSNDDDTMFVSSFEEAINLLQMHMVNPSDAEYRKRLVNYITDESNGVRSNCNAIHNFVMDLFRVGDYSLALEVCDYTLTFAPHNRDILGDAIKACGDSCQFSRGDLYLQTAMEIPTEFWSYRLFLYTIDFLKTKLEADPADKSLYEQAMDLANEYIRVFPYDEHGYNQRAELLITVNKRDEAIRDLRSSIKQVQPDKDNRKSSLVCAQCCVTLLNLLDDSNDYDDIIEIAEIGMKHTTQEQPSASIGFFMFRKALALDAKAHCDDFRKETVNSALNCYQAAYDLNQGRVSYIRTIEQRYALLRPHAEAFNPLMKRPFFIEEPQ